MVNNAPANMGLTDFFLLVSFTLTTPYYVCAFILTFGLSRVFLFLFLLFSVLCLQEEFKAVNTIHLFSLACYFINVCRWTGGGAAHRVSLFWDPGPFSFGLQRALSRGACNGAPHLSFLRRFC